MPRLIPLLAVVVAWGCGSGSITADSAVAACATAQACGFTDTGITDCAPTAIAFNSPLLANQSAGGIPIPLSPEVVNCLADARADCTAAKRCFNRGADPSSCSGEG